MAVKWILTQGIGFNPGSTRYMPPLGFLAEVAVTLAPQLHYAGPWTPDIFKRTIEGRAAIAMALTITARAEEERRLGRAPGAALGFNATGYHEAIGMAGYASTIGMKAAGKALRSRKRREQEENELLGL